MELSSGSDLFLLSSAYPWQSHPDVIRINSQSGKGGVGYILETKYGLNLPPKMREAMGYAAKAVSDHSHKELHPDEIFSLFKSTFENVVSPYSINEVHFQQKDGGIVTQVTSTFNGTTITTEAAGNGRLVSEFPHRQSLWNWSSSQAHAPDR